MYINRPNEYYVGLYGKVARADSYRSTVKNFALENAYIVGNKCVGVVLGEAIGANISNTKIDNTSIIRGKDKTNAIGGYVLVNSHYGFASKVTIDEKGELKVDNNMFGSCVYCEGSYGDR